MSLGERINSLISDLGLNQKKFASSIGVSESLISRLVKFNSLKQANIIWGIVSIYPDVNIKWLLTGEGEMYTYQSTRPIGLENQNILVPTAAFAGYTAEWPQDRGEVTVLHVPGVKGPARTFEVSGDSMYPYLLDGDYVTCVQLEEIDRVRNNEVYVIVSRENGIQIKMVRSVRDLLHLSSMNGDYKEFSILKEEVLELWEIKAKITDDVLNRSMRNAQEAKERRLNEILKKGLEGFK